MAAAQRLIDLHIHTTASDGQLAPAEIVRLAREADLAAISVTDHDTVLGQAEALEAGRREGVEVLPGVEVSADLPGSTLHILGYGIDPDHAPLREALARFRGFRDERNQRLLDRLAELGMPLDRERVLAHAAGEIVARPHFALAMVDAGYVHSTDEAFRRWLARGAPAYVERRRASPEEAVRLIRDARGLACLAHPKHLAHSQEELRVLTARLMAAGLEAVEVWHPDHAPDDVKICAALAHEMGLLATGGTDFHGHFRAGLRLGVGFGRLRVPYTVVEQIRERIAARLSVEPRPDRS